MGLDDVCWQLHAVLHRRSCSRRRLLRLRIQRVPEAKCFIDLAENPPLVPITLQFIGARHDMTICIFVSAVTVADVFICFFISRSERASAVIEICLCVASSYPLASHVVWLTYSRPIAHFCGRRRGVRQSHVDTRETLCELTRKVKVKLKLFRIFVPLVARDTGSLSHGLAVHAPTRHIRGPAA